MHVLDALFRPTYKEVTQFYSISRQGRLHRRQPRRGCRGRIPTNILVVGDINGNVPTNIRGGNVVEYELLIASVKKATLSFKK